MQTPLSPADGLILIVNFNQVQEIEKFLDSLSQHCERKHCLIVDDGSTDGSCEIAEKKGFRVIRHPKNLGVGAAIRTGLMIGIKEGYRWALISAANGKMRPNEFERVYGPVERNEADYVQGNRFLQPGGSPGLTPFRRIAIPAFSLFASLFLGKWFTDITCGLRCYTLSLLNDPLIRVDQRWLDRYELEYYLHFMAVKSRRYRIIEVPVTMKYDHIAKGRTSKIKPVTGWWSMMRPFLLLAFRLRK